MISLSIPYCYRCKTFYIHKDGLCGECLRLSQLEDQRDMVRVLDIKKLNILFEIERNDGLDFKRLKQGTGLSEGDIPHNTKWLVKNQLITIDKGFIDNKIPHTTYWITDKGIEYLKKLRRYIFSL